MAGWMINCKEYATLLSQSFDQSMSFWEKASMRMHQILCPLCKQIRSQFQAIRTACRLAPGGDMPVDAEATRLSNDVCEQMKSALRKAVNEKDI